MTAPPGTHPSRPWHDGAVAAAVALQVFAVARVSPWVQPAWAAAFALAVGLASLPSPRVRSPVLSLALSLALHAAALAAAGAAVRAMVAHDLTPSWYPRASPEANLAAGAVFLWALHAPLTLSRGWLRAHPAQDAALELAEAAGAALVAAPIALTLLHAPRAWSVALGACWSTGACLALGAAAVVWSYAAQRRRRAWMRRVLAGDEPAWQVVDADATATAPPWTHAAGGEAPARMLVPRRREGHYRAADAVTIPAAGLGARDERAWRVRRGLHALSAAWGVAWVVTLARALLHFGPPLPPPSRDPDGEVRARIAALRAEPTPCARRELAAEGRRRRVFEEEYDWRHARVEVWSSGRVEVRSRWRDRCHGEYGSFISQSQVATRCVPPPLAAAWINGPHRWAWSLATVVNSAVEDGAPASVPASCVGGAWCALRVEWPARSPCDGAEPHGVALEARGAFRCWGESITASSGAVDPRAATGLLDALRGLAELRAIIPPARALSMSIRTGGPADGERVNFLGLPALAEALYAKLCARPAP